MLKDNRTRQQKVRDTRFQNNAKAMVEQANRCALEYMEQPLEDVSSGATHAAFIGHYNLSPRQATFCLHSWIGYCAGLEEKPSKEELEKLVRDTRHFIKM